MPSFSTLSPNGRLPYPQEIYSDDTHGHSNAGRPNRARKYGYARSGTTLLRGSNSEGLGVTDFGYGVDLERAIDAWTPLPPLGGVWWWYRWSNSYGATAQTREEASMPKFDRPLRDRLKLRPRAR